MVFGVEVLGAGADVGEAVVLDCVVPSHAHAAGFEFLTVVKAVAGAQQIGFLYRLAAQAHRVGGLGDCAFDHEHGLRSAEAAEGGVRREVGAAADRHHAGVGNVVGVGGVQQTAFEPSASSPSLKSQA